MEASSNSIEMCSPEPEDLTGDEDGRLDANSMNGNGSVSGSLNEVPVMGGSGANLAKRMRHVELIGMDEDKPEPPSSKSIARNLTLTWTPTAGGSQQDSDNEDQEFNAKPKTAAVVTLRRSEMMEGEKVPKLQELARVKSQPEAQEFRRELFKVLKQYFKAAFTIIVKRRRLCPSSGFQTVRVLGVKVPRFLHPSSLEYVEEVSQKLLMFLNRNTTDGCTVHIMVEKRSIHISNYAKTSFLIVS